MVLAESDSNVILIKAMKNCTSGEVIRTFQSMIDWLHTAGITLKHHILDNKCSTEFNNDTIKANKMLFQLIPPHDHHRNRAKKAFQTFKDHFVAILCSMDKEFPHGLWDLQAESTLNML